MALMRNNMKSPARRSLGFSADKVSDMYTPAPSQNKFDWFTLPDGPDGKPLELWTTPKTPMICKFDVLAITHSYDYSIYWAQQQRYTYPVDYWFSRRVRVHRIQDKEYLCKGSVHTFREDHDPICDLLWEDKNSGRKELDYQAINRMYEIFLIRMHLDNHKYKFYIYIDSFGKFGKQLYDEYEILKNTPEESRTDEDRENLLFFDPFQNGKTISARFSQVSKDLPDRTTHKTTKREWFACTKLDFIPREDPLTEEEQDWIENKLDVDACLKFPSDEVYDKLAKLLVNQEATSVETTEANNVPESTPSVEPEPVVRRISRPKIEEVKEVRPAPQAKPSEDDDPFAEELSSTESEAPVEEAPIPGEDKVEDIDDWVCM